VSWGEGIDGVLHDFGGVPYDTFNRTGFNAMKLHLSSARAATLAFPPPATVLRPWLAFKSFSPRLPGFLPDSGPTHYYEEEVIHAAITGADFFLYFNSWSGYLYGTRAVAADHKLLSDVHLPRGTLADNEYTIFHVRPIIMGLSYARSRYCTS